MSSERGSRADSLNDIQMYQVAILSMLIPMEIFEMYDIAMHFPLYLWLCSSNDGFIENV